MSMIPFTPDKPADSQARDSATVRNDLNALFRGDLSPLRARAQSTPNMTVAVAGTDVESFWREVWIGVDLPLNYAGGNSSTITAPAANPRIDLLTIDSAGTLAWTTGAEAASPTPPNCPSGKVPICWIYCKTTMIKIVNYENMGANPNEGYIYRDVRPFLNLGGLTSIIATNFQNYSKTLFGDGSDGDVTISTDTTLGDSGVGVKVMKYNNLTINAAKYLTAHANDKVLVLLVKGTLTINGTIKMDIRGGDGGVGSATYPGGGGAGAFGGGGGEGSGAVAGGGGGGGGFKGMGWSETLGYGNYSYGGGKRTIQAFYDAPDIFVVTNQNYEAIPAIGYGIGGNGTKGAADAGLNLVSPKSLFIFEIFRYLYGGGGGGGNASGYDGGRGGGIIWIEANNIVWGGSGLITSNGGAGVTKGGGGGGGGIQVVYKSKTGSSTYQATGGAAGGNAGAGAAGISIESQVE